MSLKHVLLSGLILLSASSSVTAATYTRTHSGGLALPDFISTQSILNIPDATMIDYLTLRINNLTHPFVVDLHISLIAPNGTTVMVFDGNGGSGDNIVDMWMDQRSSYAVQNANAPFTGVFAPDNSMAPFSGMSALGDWKLSVYDSGAGDHGVLYQWALAVNEPIPEPSTTAMLLIAAGGLVVVRLRRV